MNFIACSSYSREKSLFQKLSSGNKTKLSEMAKLFPEFSFPSLLCLYLYDFHFLDKVLPLIIRIAIWICFKTIVSFAAKAMHETFYLCYYLNSYFCYVRTLVLLREFNHTANFDTEVYLISFFKALFTIGPNWTYTKMLLKIYSFRP